MSAKKRFSIIVRKSAALLFPLLTALIQHSFFPGIITSFPFMPSVTLAVAITSLSDEYSGLLAGIAAGVVWDFASPAADGIFTLTLAAALFVCGLLSRTILRRTLLSASLQALIILVFANLTALIFNVIMFDKTGALSVFTSRYVPGIFVSMLSFPPFYFIAKKCRDVLTPRTEF